MRSPPYAAPPTAPAAWHCSACARDLCDACAATVAGRVAGRARRLRGLRRLGRAAHRRAEVRPLLKTVFTGAFPRLLVSAGFLGACAAALVRLGLQASSR